MALNTVQVTDRLLALVQADDYAGFDPFDGLNSRLLQKTHLDRFGLVRLAWLQLFKRLPVNLRPLVSIPKKRNPKGVGLFLLGLLEDWQRTGQYSFLDEALKLGDWLLANRCDAAEWGHHCWGYHFDWQARAFYVPAGKPNIITTAYVGRALIALAEASGREVYLHAGIDAARFVDSRLFTETAGSSYYAYIPGERAFVHNASLWGAALVVMGGRLSARPDMVDRGLFVARQSALCQAENGSWAYGTLPHHQFVDGFHTGYNLEALSLIDDVSGMSEFREVIRKGFDYYKQNFFLENGAAKYYDNNPYPLDTHSAAQAILTLLKLAQTPEDRQQADKVIRWAMDALYLPDKARFIYQKDRYFTNRINYIRWTQAWAYYALAFYNRHKLDKGNGA